MATHLSETLGPGCKVCSENQYTSSGLDSGKKKIFRTEIDTSINWYKMINLRVFFFTIAISWIVL